MSTNKRKIGLYSFEIVNKNNVKLTERELVRFFNTLIRFINVKEFSAKKEKTDTSNKFYYISYHDIKRKKVDTYLKGESVSVIFESAKIGHRPKLIDETTGLKRENPKTYNEGEDELTHLVYKYKQNEVLVALEERRVGVTASQIVKYLNKYILEFPLEKHYEINYNIIPYDNFLENLKEFKKIQVGTVYIDQQEVGSEFLNIAEFGETVRDPVEIVFKAPVRKTIKRKLVTKWYDLTTRSKKIKRIRLEGKSFDGAKIRLDTDSLKLTEHIDVKLIPDTGIVESEDIFKQLDTLIKKL